MGSGRDAVGPLSHLINLEFAGHFRVLPEFWEVFPAANVADFGQFGQLREALQPRTAGVSAGDTQLDPIQLTAASERESSVR